MIRVAQISPLYESVPPRFYGGTERVVYNLCRGLTDANIEVTLFASGDSTIEGKIVPIVDEALRLKKIPVFDQNAYNIRMLAHVAQFAGEFDVIHNHNDYWMLPLTEMLDTPVLSTLHGRLDIPDVPETLLNFPKAAFVSISDAQRIPLKPLNWIKTIYHGIDADHFVFHPKPGKYLAFLGRISHEKKPEWAIEIAKRAGVPLKIAAKIDGKEGKDYFDKHVKKHIDGKNVEYIGEISESEKSSFLGEALALIFPIDWPEPFGLVMIESLACGTPILARPCGSVPELLQEGVTGFSHMDIHRLADKVKNIPSIDRKICRKIAEEKFSLKRMTEDYIHVYRLLAERRRASHHRRNLLHSV